MLIKGQDVSHIVFGNTLPADGLLGKRFDYMLSNPPFGVEWKKIEAAVRKEYAQQGFSGRFGPGLPRVSDMFYNTGISTYVWILSNRKPEHRGGRVQLIDASRFWQKLRKSLGSKRKEMSDEHIATVTRLFGDFVQARLAVLTDVAGEELGRQVLLAGEADPVAPQDGKVRVMPISRIFRNEVFGYRTITVERPLRDASGQPVLGHKGKAKGQPQPDPKLRDTENVPLAENVTDYPTLRALRYTYVALTHRKLLISVRDHTVGQEQLSLIKQILTDLCVTKRAEGPGPTRAAAVVPGRCADPLRDKQRADRHDDPTPGSGDPLSALRSRRRGRGRQPAEPRRAPQRLWCWWSRTAGCWTISFRRRSSDWTSGM